MAVNHVVCLDLPDEIQHLLRSAHRKGGDDHIAAPVECSLQNLRQFARIVRRAVVQPVAVGGFHDDIIGFFQISRVLDDGLIRIPYISGEHQHSVNPVFLKFYFDGGGAKQVTGIDKTDFDALRDPLFLIVGNAHKTPDRSLRILCGVHRLYGRAAGAFRLAVLPLCFKLLNVGGVHQHDL